MAAWSEKTSIESLSIVWHPLISGTDTARNRRYGVFCMHLFCVQSCVFMWLLIWWRYVNMCLGICQLIQRVQPWQRQKERETDWEKRTSGGVKWIIVGALGAIRWLDQATNLCPHQHSETYPCVVWPANPRFSGRGWAISPSSLSSAPHPSDACQCHLDIFVARPMHASNMRVQTMLFKMFTTQERIIRPKKKLI